jgi:hypothetical protein
LRGWWWWWRVVVIVVIVVLNVGKELSHDLHKLSLGFHHLLHMFLRSATRRHLLGLRIGEVRLRDRV